MTIYKTMPKDELYLYYTSGNKHNRFPHKIFVGNDREAFQQKLEEWLQFCVHGNMKKLVKTLIYAYESQNQHRQMAMLKDVCKQVIYRNLAHTSISQMVCTLSDQFQETWAQIKHLVLLNETRTIRQQNDVQTKLLQDMKQEMTSFTENISQLQRGQNCLHQQQQKMYQKMTESRELNFISIREHMNKLYQQTVPSTQFITFGSALDSVIQSKDQHLSQYSLTQMNNSNCGTLQKYINQTSLSNQNETLRNLYSSLRPILCLRDCENLSTNQSLQIDNDYEHKIYITPQQCQVLCIQNNTRSCVRMSVLLDWQFSNVSNPMETFTNYMLHRVPLHKLSTQSSNVLIFNNAEVTVNDVHMYYKLSRVLLPNSNLHSLWEVYEILKNQQIRTCILLIRDNGTLSLSLSLFLI
ncbi:MAG: hypothetical protein GY938_04975 [Ketobacter sp.]|nr:hypothetical protein [Ketobacter sp.]